MSPGPARPDSAPFGGPGLFARAAPFALVAIAAEASLALPPGTHTWTEVAVSLDLLALVPLAILLPWDRLPGWMPVLVPLLYAGSVLALTLAAGTISGVGIVVLIPLIWTVLFHRRWESACVLIAIVVVEVVVSVDQSAPNAVIVRRVLLWAALGALLAVAAHGLRDRIQQSLAANARLQERIGELMVVQDRDRLAADLQSSVVQRIFAAGLKLQGVLSLAAQPEVRQRVESSVTDLDDAIRLVRQAIFGLEHRLDRVSLRQQVLRLCAGLSPVPEITFAGPVDDALLPAAAAQLVEMLRVTLSVIGPQVTQTSLCLEVGENLRVVVVGTDPRREFIGDDQPAWDFPRCSTRPARPALPSRSSRWPTGPSSPGVSRAGPARPCRRPPPDAPPRPAPRTRPMDESPSAGRRTPLGRGQPGLRCSGIPWFGRPRQARGDMR